MANFAGGWKSAGSPLQAPPRTTARHRQAPPGRGTARHRQAEAPPGTARHRQAPHQAPPSTARHRQAPPGTARHPRHPRHRQTPPGTPRHRQHRQHRQHWQHRPPGTPRHHPTNPAPPDPGGTGGTYHYFLVVYLACVCVYFPLYILGGWARATTTFHKGTGYHGSAGLPHGFRQNIGEGEKAACVRSFSKPESTNQEAAECRGPESCRRRRGGETVLDRYIQGAWRETVRRAFDTLDQTHMKSIAVELPGTVAYHVILPQHLSSKCRHRVHFGVGAARRRMEFLI
jgi:hypothetical protein